MIHPESPHSTGTGAGSDPRGPASVSPYRALGYVLALIQGAVVVILGVSIMVTAYEEGFNDLAGFAAIAGAVIVALGSMTFAGAATAIGCVRGRSRMTCLPTGTLMVLESFTVFGAGGIAASDRSLAALAITGSSAAVIALVLAGSGAEAMRRS